MDLDDLVLRLKELGVVIAIAAPIGFLCGQVIGWYNAIKLDKRFEERTAENLGLEYERDISRIVLREVQIERFGFSVISEFLYNQELLDLYLRRHPEKKVEWELKKKTCRAKYLGDYIDVKCEVVS